MGTLQTIAWLWCLFGTLVTLPLMPGVLAIVAREGRWGWRAFARLVTTWLLWPAFLPAARREWNRG